MNEALTPTPITGAVYATAQAGSLHGPDENYQYVFADTLVKSSKYKTKRRQANTRHKPGAGISRGQYVGYMNKLNEYSSNRRSVDHAQSEYRVASIIARVFAES